MCIVWLKMTSSAPDGSAGPYMPDILYFTCKQVYVHDSILFLSLLNLLSWSPLFYGLGGFLCDFVNAVREKRLVTENILSILINLQPAT